MRSERNTVYEALGEATVEVEGNLKSKSEVMVELEAKLKAEVLAKSHLADLS